MTTTDYVAFLRNKTATAPAVGIEVDAVSDALRPFQQAIVRWALRRGKAKRWDGGSVSTPLLTRTHKKCRQEWFSADTG